MSNLKFINDGIESVPNFFNKKECKKLLNQALKKIDFKKIFKSEKEFNKKKKFKDVNPRVGRNLISTLDTRFIFLDKRFNELMNKTMGNSWRVLDYKFVCAMPPVFIPEWVKKKLKGEFVPNLGAYIKEKFQNVTFFRGIDYHQDIIDFPDRDSDFITAYVYLDKVNDKTSPIVLLPKSHKLGASIFPHNITKIKNKKLLLKNDFNKSIIIKPKVIRSGGGTLSYWHCSTLHGTKPIIGKKPRISVRILVEKNSKRIEKSLIDKVNKKIIGKLSLIKTRNDLTKSGKSKIKGNFLHKSKII
jgi:hypothetical protein